MVEDMPPLPGRSREEEAAPRGGPGEASAVEAAPASVEAQVG